MFWDYIYDFGIPCEWHDGVKNYWVNRDNLLVRNFKGRKSLLTKFDLEKQNIDIKYTGDSSNLDKVLSFKAYYLLITFLYMLKKKKKGFVMQNSCIFPFLRSLYEWISTSGQFSISHLGSQYSVVGDMV